VYKDISDIPQAVKDKMKHFFEHYKELEPGKWVKIKDWKGKTEALAAIKKSMVS
jgi:inorganic pyrophosphatase